MGIAAGVLTQLSGSTVDRWGSAKVLLIATGLGALSTLVIAFGERSTVVVILGLFAVTLANQLTQVANQARILRAPSLAGRTNLGYSPLGGVIDRLCMEGAPGLRRSDC